MSWKSLALAGVLSLSTSALASESDVFDAIGSSSSRADSWDSAVQAAMLATYDTNHSGSIDKGSELKAISCTVWSALESAVADGWEGTGFRVIYGFKKGFIWVGYAWNINEKLRKSADKAASKCGIE